MIAILNTVYSRCLCIPLNKYTDNYCKDVIKRYTLRSARFDKAQLSFFLRYARVHILFIESTL